MKEETTMKTRETAKQAAYIGAGAGLVGFALVGLMPGSFLGGVIGLNLAGALFGLPLTSALVPRLIVCISMLLGVFVSALMCVSASSIAGWLIGLAIDSLKVDRAVPAEAKH
jgi:Mg/Co/Ni transporter MgtE